MVKLYIFAASFLLSIVAQAQNCNSDDRTCDLDKSKMQLLQKLGSSNSSPSTNKKVESSISQQQPFKIPSPGSDNKNNTIQYNPGLKIFSPQNNDQSKQNQQEQVKNIQDNQVKIRSTK